MTSASKEFKMHRSTADRLLKGLTERIAIYNDNPWKPYVVERAVVFGSYVNAPEKEMLSDLDIGIKLTDRYEGEICKIAFELEYDEILERCPSYRHRLEMPVAMWGLTYDEALRYLRNRSHYISFHPIGEDAAIFSDVTREIDVGEIDRSTDWYDEWFGDNP